MTPANGLGAEMVGCKWNRWHILAPSSHWSWKSICLQQLVFEISITQNSQFCSPHNYFMFQYWGLRLKNNSWITSEAHKWSEVDYPKRKASKIYPWRNQANLCLSSILSLWLKKIIIKNNVIFLRSCVLLSPILSRFLIHSTWADPLICACCSFLETVWELWKNNKQGVQRRKRI